MFDIQIPDHLGIDHPADMPIIKLAAKLFDKGYILSNGENGNLVAIPICGHKNKKLTRAGGHWHCECGSVFTDKDLSLAALAAMPAPSQIDRPAWDEVCDGCGRRKRSCLCSSHNSDDSKTF